MTVPDHEPGLTDEPFSASAHVAVDALGAIVMLVLAQRRRYPGACAVIGEGGCQCHGARARIGQLHLLRGGRFGYGAEGESGRAAHHGGVDGRAGIQQTVADRLRIHEVTQIVLRHGLRIRRIDQRRFHLGRA